ncbi:MAG: hypothetical protein L3K26_17690, partial [Candidatus Hydrogenedentes bacterium]|nr:hypothetical protein [Candidatus Hydrogenedentota bacterium]
GRSTDMRRAPEALPGAYEIKVEALAGSDSEGMVRVTVVTHTTRGHEIVVSAACMPGASRYAM